MTNHRIEDYALIGDMRTAALVCRDGTIDWLCLPRFDSPAVFAALLGNDEHGGWRLGPASPSGPRPADATRRSYRGDSLILESEWDTAHGTVRVTDFMPPQAGTPQLIRIVEGVTGAVLMRSDLRMRFGYGQIVPWIRVDGGRTVAVAGPDSLWLDSTLTTQNAAARTSTDFTVKAGEKVAFSLAWHSSHHGPPEMSVPDDALEVTEDFWRNWVSRCTYCGPYRDAVVRSLITLKALTYAPTGGIVAAPTTSLPEGIGGVRNWDYRYTWLRDAAITLSALLRTGYRDEARAWREWLLRAVAGDPDNLQIMYGIGGERSLPEMQLPWLPGYEGSAPVRIGNAAAGQLQLDVYGEVVEALHLAHQSGLDRHDSAHRLQLRLIETLERRWREPDEGIWEVRGPRRHFVHSKVMAWTAIDRTIQLLESGEIDGPLTRWRQLRATIHREVCERGFDPERHTFTQSYGSKELDASVLLIPQVGFLPPDDKRVIGTIEAVQRDLCTPDGFLLRYPTDGARKGVDGLPGDEGAFLACSFWLADDLAMIGRMDEARGLFEKLLALRNDVGLLAEEWDPRLKRQVGNYPQAFSHLTLVGTALRLGDLSALPRPRGASVTEQVVAS
ncbi:glycoside hydrolase family 15 protein [Streptomyces sp. NPDC047072]|uniref:glycoside hydrolase family 15 protein n=1 Tax=Streptomyces sp. NPDC047072 TaxID=3154809 RepID=UPI00340E6A34